jgi:uncharacterized protein (UPF0276 family)
MSTRAPLGFGIGLRPKHYTEFLEGSPRVDWVEAISENFMGVGGRPLAVLERVRRDRPVVLHGVSLGIASVAPFDEAYWREWKALVHRIEPAIVSDHLCWGRAHGRYAHDLLPVPFTWEAVQHTVERVQRVQDFLGRRIALENVSSYLTFADSELTEWDFLREVVTRAGCDVLLDVNNIFVSARNHGFDPDAYLAAIPVGHVAQFHLAGHQRRPELIIDTHDGPVSDEVWGLYERALKRFGPVSTLIEWDDAVPELPVLLAEAEKARARAEGMALRVEPRPVLSELVEDRRTELSRTQSLLFDAITSPTEVSSDAQALIAPHAPLSAKARIEVYAEMYWLRLRDALREGFPTVRAALGDEHFDAHVADFLRAHASTHFSLDRFGAPFPAFLRTAAPEWADVAALEWARAESFLSVDGAVVGFDALQAIPAEAWGEVTLRTHPSLRLLSLERDPLPALRAHREGHTPEVPPSAPTTLVIWRQDFVAFHAPVSAIELEALRALLEGLPLGDVLAPFGDDAEAAFAALRSWFTEGMVSAVAS